MEKNQSTGSFYKTAVKIVGGAVFIGIATLGALYAYKATKNADCRVPIEGFTAVYRQARMDAAELANDTIDFGGWYMKTATSAEGIKQGLERDKEIVQKALKGEKITPDYGD
jgi:hypothetical protein